MSLNLCFSNQNAPCVKVIWVFFQLLLCLLHLLWNIFSCSLQDRTNGGGQKGYVAEQTCRALRYLWGNESGLLLDRATATSRYKMFTFLTFRSHASARCDTNASLENLHRNKVTGNKHTLSTTDWFDWHQGKTYTNIIHRN